jgi:hypothetical protein
MKLLVILLISSILLVLSLVLGCTLPTGATSTPEPVTDIEPATKVPIQDVVYINHSGKEYHRADCQYLTNTKVQVSRSLVIERGYQPCSFCKP